jgi:hypothetical protein
METSIHGSSSNSPSRSSSVGHTHRPKKKNYDSIPIIKEPKPKESVRFERKKPQMIHISPNKNLLRPEIAKQLSALTPSPLFAIPKSSILTFQSGHYKQIFKAVKENNVLEVEELLDRFIGLSLEVKDTFGNTPVLIAV